MNLQSILDLDCLGLTNTAFGGFHTRMRKLNVSVVQSSLPRLHALDAKDIGKVTNEEGDPVKHGASRDEDLSANLTENLKKSLYT